MPKKKMRQTTNSPEAARILLFLSSVTRPERLREEAHEIKPERIREGISRDAAFDRSREAAYLIWKVYCLSNQANVSSSEIDKLQDDARKHYCVAVEMLIGLGKPGAAKKVLKQFEVALEDDFISVQDISKFYLRFSTRKGDDNHKRAIKWAKIARTLGSGEAEASRMQELHPGIFSGA